MNVVPASSSTSCPRFPLDGGPDRPRAIAWKLTGDRNRGTRFSARAGPGLRLPARSASASSCWLRRRRRSAALWLVRARLVPRPGGAQRGRRRAAFTERLEGVTVADVMDPQPVTIAGATTALDAPRTSSSLRYRWPWFAVVDDERALPRGRRAPSAVDARASAAGQPGADRSASSLGRATRESARRRADQPLEALLGSEPLRAPAARSWPSTPTASCAASSRSSRSAAPIQRRSPRAGRAGAPRTAVRPIEFRGPPCPHTTSSSSAPASPASAPPSPPRTRARRSRS